jgi:predicted metal-dependent peptidase
MDKSTNYFSAKKEVIYDDLFNSDNIAGLEDYIMLHPKLRKIFAEDLQVKDTKSIGKIDIYIDVSGSMSSYCGAVNSKGDSISKIDFCKAFTAKLKSMDMLNEIFLFDNKVKECRNDIVSISMISCGGGTTIDKAVEKIEKEGRNALVITDAEDHCSIYSDKAFFIGVQGANFNYFNNEIIKEYSNRGQVVVFDGTRISKVDVFGKII